MFPECTVRGAFQHRPPWILKPYIYPMVYAIFPARRHTRTTDKCNAFSTKCVTRCGCNICTLSVTEVA